MRILYSFLMQIAAFLLWIAQYFSKKLKLFVSGRKDVFEILKNKINPLDKTVWFHCASLGEFEQATPIIEAIKLNFPEHKIVISFFSPSGYEIKKKTPIADAVIYLPLDTPRNAKRLIKAIHPSLVLFVKYEFWPNYLLELKKNKIPTLLVSGVFRKKQMFFKWYGGFMRKALGAFNHFFVQDLGSKNLLENINHSNITFSGDTRFDRVSQQIEIDNALPFMDNFTANSLCIVCGSTWPEDELVLLDSINSASEYVKFVIAPHKIDPSKIESFRKKIIKKSALYSKDKEQDLNDYSVLFIDTIGLLPKIYSYADIAYVGGAMGSTGLHNILEPATFGVPIVIGNTFDKFPEAKKLQRLAGLFSVTSSQECTQIFSKLIQDKSFRNKTGMITGHFINSNTGATDKIMNYIMRLNSDGLV